MPTYFLIRSNPDTKWGDTSGKTYRFGSTVHNHQKLMDGGHVLVDRSSKHGALVIGIGVLGPATVVPPRPNESITSTYYECSYTEWRTFVVARPLTSSLSQQLITQPGYNVRYSIRPIDEALFAAIIQYMDAKPDDVSVTGPEHALAVEDSAPRTRPETDPVPERELAVPFTVDDAMHELFMDHADFAKALRLLSYKKNLILQGSPGVGKTFVAKRLAYALIGRQASANIETVQFHQAYSYEDFIQGFRPREDESGFAIRDGIFHRFCDTARKAPDDKFVFIIDEINRGNLGKIFGELLMLIEADKRSENWALRLAYADEKKPRFYVPDNVYIIGMMNTADRSLTSIDYALRRRFAFIQVKPGFSHRAFNDYLGTQGWSPTFAYRISSRFIALNKQIAKDEDLREGFCIGHSYFCSKRPDGMTDDEYFADIIDTEIRPLLEDYWFDRKPAELTAIIDDLHVK